VSGRKASNLLKRRVLSTLPKTKLGFEKSAFSRWAAKQFKNTARLGQGFILMKMA